MKDSGVEWIGEIPEDWEVVKLKNVAKIVTGNTPSMSNEEYYSNSSGIPWIKPENLLEFKGVSDTKLKLTISGKLQGRIVPKGTMLICAIGNIGKFGYTNEDSAFNQQINAIIFNSKIVERYGLYCLSVQKEQQNYYGNGNVVQILNANNQGMVYFTTPPKSQQQSIADFLDKKTKEIDNIITKTKKVIEEYKKYKQSLITEIVTKGLNKDVKMKDSGIEWIGEIPVHWELIRLQSLVKLRDSKGLYNPEKDLYIGLENIKSYTGKYVDTETKYEENIYTEFKSEDLLFNTLRPYLTKIYLTNCDGYCTSEFLIIKKYKGIKQYLFYQLINSRFIEIVNSSTYGSKMPRVNWNFMKDIFLPVPPLQEQKSIASYLDNKCSQINNIITTKEKLLTEMESYKKSLIYEAVTGKREVE